ncbi:unnamed protein product, partial [Cyprideis torosa]
MVWTSLFSGMPNREICFVVLLIICCLHIKQTQALELNPRMLVESNKGTGAVKKPLPPNVREEVALELIRNLTHPDNYSLHVKPPQELVNVRTRIFLYYITGFSTVNTEFTIQALFQYVWRDERLDFSHVPDIPVIEGEGWLEEMIWTPNIYFVNEKDSEHFDVIKKNVFVAI